ncbi:MAG: hypothetical protein ACK559_02130, partial [bacterium]
LDGGDAGGHGLGQQAEGIAPFSGHRPGLAPFEADDHAPGPALALQRGARLRSHALSAQACQPSRLGRTQCRAIHDPGVCRGIGRSGQVLGQQRYRFAPGVSEHVESARRIGRESVRVGVQFGGPRRRGPEG